MPVAITTRSVIPYVCKEDRKLLKSEQTIFFLPQLSFRALCEFQETLKGLGDSEDEEDGLRTQFNVIIRILGTSLRGWENFKDAEGKAVDFETQVAEGFPGMSFILCKELLYSILRENAISEEEEGNSKSSPELLKVVSSTDTDEDAPQENLAEESGDATAPQ